MRAAATWLRSGGATVRETPDVVLNVVEWVQTGAQQSTFFSHYFCVGSEVVMINS